MPENGDGELFSGLANPTRLEILDRLQKKPLRIARLAEATGITIQAIQRHIDKLLESGLIIKDMDGNLGVSAIGAASLAQIPTFLFLSKYKNYFQNHSFSGISKSLVKRIGDLSRCEFLEDPMLGWQRAKHFVESAEKFLYGVTAVQPIEFYDVAKTLIKKGVKFQMVFPQNMIVAKGFGQKREKNGWLECLKTGQAQEKFVQNIPIMVGVSEKEAQLIFASKKTGHIDSGSLFYSKDQDFRNWCLELFNYYWNEVEKVSPPQIQEI